jgi:hypothetical protein
MIKPSKRHGSVFWKYFTLLATLSPLTLTHALGIEDAFREKGPLAPASAVSSNSLLPNLVERNDDIFAVPDVKTL